jgi:hypothetical protein
MHPAASVAAGLFALAELRPVSGRELLHAFIAGVETSCRVGLAVMPTHYRRGLKHNKIDWVRQIHCMGIVYPDVGNVLQGQLIDNPIAHLHSFFDWKRPSSIEMLRCLSGVSQGLYLPRAAMHSITAFRPAVWQI